MPHRYRTLAASSIALFLLLLTDLGKMLAQSNASSQVPLQSQSVDGLLAKFERSDAPGVTVAVFRAGEIIYKKAAGMADLELDVRLTPDSVFDIASMSKQFTAMAGAFGGRWAPVARR
jgi:CubicO group peptidase (beta-lactamase class C family)